jgi:signal transduction histidine kinase
VALAQTVQRERLRHSLDAAEAERRRWARELHDETLQGLGGLRVLLATALHRAEAGEIADLLRKGVGEVAASGSARSSRRPSTGWSTRR